MFPGFMLFPVLNRSHGDIGYTVDESNYIMEEKDKENYNIDSRINNTCIYCQKPTELRIAYNHPF
jgi:hypothetical protein